MISKKNNNKKKKKKEKKKEKEWEKEKTSNDGDDDDDDDCDVDEDKDDGSDDLYRKVHDDCGGGGAEPVEKAARQECDALRGQVVELQAALRDVKAVLEQRPVVQDPQAKLDAVYAIVAGLQLHGQSQPSAPASPQEIAEVKAVTAPQNLGIVEPRALLKTEAKAQAADAPKAIDRATAGQGEEVAKEV